MTSDFCGCLVFTPWTISTKKYGTMWKKDRIQILSIEVTGKKHMNTWDCKLSFAGPIIEWSWNYVIVCIVMPALNGDLVIRILSLTDQFSMNFGWLKPWCGGREVNLGIRCRFFQMFPGWWKICLTYILPTSVFFWCQMIESDPILFSCGMMQENTKKHDAQQLNMH